MDVQKRYNEILSLKKQLQLNITMNSFLSNHQQELLRVLDTPVLDMKCSKQALLALLDDEQSSLSIMLQSAYQFT